MKKKLLILFILFSIKNLSQVGIGTITPNSNSILDLTSTQKGFLLPRIALQGATNPLPINSSAANIPIGLIVYNTASITTLGQELNANKIHMWNGSKWDELISSTALSNSLINLGIPKIVFRGGITGTQTLDPDVNSSNIPAMVNFNNNTGDQTGNYSNITRLFTISEAGLYRVIGGFNITNNSGTTDTYISQINDNFGVSDTRSLCSPCANSLTVVSVSRYNVGQTVGLKLFSGGSDNAVEVNSAFIVIEKLGN